MNKNAKLWIRALESGRFKQGKDRLRVVSSSNPDRFCCLGVACELYRQRRKKGSWSDFGMFLQSSTVLSKDVYRWLGMFSDEGSFAIEDKPKTKKLKDVHANISLAILNDRGYTFKEIARFIKKHPKLFFVDDIKKVKTHAHA